MLEWISPGEHLFIDSNGTLTSQCTLLQWPSRHFRITLLFITCAVLFSSVVTSQPSRAGTIAQSEARIADLSSRLARLSQSGEVTANAYDAATAQLAVVNHQIDRLHSRISALRISVVRASAELTDAIIRSYVAWPLCVNAG